MAFRLERSVACRSLTAAALLACLVPRGQAQPVPTFRSGVDLVTVDVSVLDRDGAPVEGLGPDDFLLRIDGELRPVASAEFVTLATPLAWAGEPRPVHYSSNRYADTGRLILIAVDQRHIRRVDGAAALRAAASFVEALHPDDRVAVTSLTYAGPIEFTRNHRAASLELARLTGQRDLFASSEFTIGLSEAMEISEGGRRALERVVLRECGSPIADLMVDVAREDGERQSRRDACPQQVEQEARAIAHHARLEAAMSLRALHAQVARLGRLDGPKTLVLLSEGLAADPRHFDLADLAAAALAARVTIYVVKLDAPIFEAAEARESPTRFQDLHVLADGLARVAGAGRGALFHLVGGDPRPFARISRETSGYYLLAFEPAPVERDGRSRRIEVSLRHGRALVRHRPAFRIERETLAPAPGDQVARLLQTARLATELPVSVATHLYREPGTTKLRVVVSVETDAPDAAESGALVGFVLRNAEEVITASGIEAAPGGRHAFSMFVEPGEYTLKVAALDGLRRGGSVERPFTAAIPRARQLEVSDLILARLPARDDEPLAPVVDRAPNEPHLLAYLELYEAGEPLPAGTAVRLDLAASPDGAALVTAPAELRRGAAGIAVARAVLPIEGLTPGRYVARADVVVAGEPLQRVVRAFRIDPDRRRASR